MGGGHIGIRLVNPKDENYDKTKPTYIQFYDDRLLSPEKQRDTKNLIFDYDMSPSDNYDIISDDDSVRPYAFEVDPYDKKIQLAFRPGQNTRLIKDFSKDKCGIELNDFLSFTNYTIATKEDAQGATFWDGNVDIFKLNTSNPGSDARYRKGCEDARNYLYGVATYWTETIQRDLILKTALMDNNDKRNTASQNRISPKRYNDMLVAIKNGKSVSPILEQGKTIEQYVKEFPLQSIETDMDLGAVFSQPQFNEEFLNPTTLTMLTNLVDDTIEAAIPENYKNNEEYKTFAVKIFANDVIKNILAGAMGQGIIKNDGTIDMDKLGAVNLKTLAKREPFSPEDERNQVIKTLTKGISQDSTISIRKALQDKLRYISLEDFKLAESIVLQGKGGLNWRFDAAKDIGDIDAIRDGRATFDQIWNGDALNPGVKEFWGEFIKNIRQYNPASYIINEITMLDSFYIWQNMDSMYDFDPKSAAAYEKLSEEQKSNYKYHPPYSLEMNYIAQSNSTAGSIFDNYFNNLSALAGTNPEDGTNVGAAGDLYTLKNQVDGLLTHAYPNSAMFAHFFTENHDKPRMLHTLPLDMTLYVTPDLSQANGFYKLLAQDITGGRTDYRNISSKAVAVGAVMRDEIEKQYASKPEIKKALLESLQNFVNGRRTKDDENNFKRADVFGTVPYEISFEDVMKNAGLESEIKNVRKMHKDMLNEAIQTQESLTQVSSCLVGTPTIFNGAEFAQTGYETKNKNVYVSNRNQILHELAEDELYKDNYRKNYAIQGLYQKKDLGALRDGTPISLKVSTQNVDNNNVKTDNLNNADSCADKNAAEALIYKIKQFILRDTRSWSDMGGVRTIDGTLLFNTLEKLRNTDHDEYKKALSDILKMEDFEQRQFEQNYNYIKHYFTQGENSSINFYPIFKYDEKGSQVLTVITDNGLPTNKYIEADFEKNGQNEHGDAKIKVKKPKATYEVKGIEVKDENDICPIPQGTTLKRKIYDAQRGDYIDDEREYVIMDGYIKEKNNRSIKIDDTALYFYIPRVNKSAEYGTGYHGAH